MKYINVPAPISLKIPFTNKKALIRDEKGDRPAEPIKFKEFVLTALLNDERFMKNFASLTAANKILGVLSKEESVISLEDSDWTVLADVAKNPSAGTYGPYAPVMAAQLLPFLKAIIEATEAPNS